MDIPDPILAILACPETRQSLTKATAHEIEQLNLRISRGEVHNNCGSQVTEILTAGLIRKDGAVFYPIRDGIPVLLAEEGIPYPRPL